MLPAHPVPSELQAVWRRLMVTGLPLAMLGVCAALLFPAHDSWSATIGRLYNAAVLLMLCGLWLAALRRSVSQTKLLQVMVVSAGVIFITKMSLLLLFQPDPVQLFVEAAQTLIWLAPLLTWAMLTDLSQSMKRALHATLLSLLTISGLLVLRHWLADHIFDAELFKLLLHFNLAAFLTFYGSNAYLLRNDHLGRLQGERDALSRLAYTDLLTELPNRHRLKERMLALTQTEHSTPFSLLFIDVDAFKIVNDTLGHAAGDDLLRRVGHELTRLSPVPDSVYRVSGDEFVVLLPGLDGAAAEETAHTLQREAALTSAPDGGMLTTLSIGISVFPEDSRHPSELLRHADSAMYSVKRAGRGHVRRYCRQHDSATERYQELTHALSQARENNELRLVFQPVFRLSDLKMVKVEALVRWTHSKLGVVSPGEFIPVAEQSGLIVSIGQWILAESCRAVQQWDSLTVSVNVSGLQLLRADFPAQVARILSETGLSPERLELELTETALIYEDTRAISSVSELQRMGLSVSLDDYGSGYSNLERLRTLNVGGIKLDQSIIRALGKEDSEAFAAAVTQSTVVLAQALRVPLTAEGIETPELLERVKGLGCDLGQGYGLSKPLPPEEISQLYAG